MTPGKTEPGPRVHAQKLVKFNHVVPEISVRTDRQTHTHTQTDSSQYSAVRTTTGAEYLCCLDEGQFSLMAFSTAHAWPPLKVHV